MAPSDWKLPALPAGYQLVPRTVAEGVQLLDIATPLGTATLSLHGGQVLQWQPIGQRHPVLWVSPQVAYESRKAIRAGAPICWPWFGPMPGRAELPGHGYARVRPWRLDGLQVLDDGSLGLALELPPSPADPAPWADALGLRCQVRVGTTLSITLTTINRGQQPLRYTEGLHTYFTIGDIHQASVDGLEDVVYVDLVKGNERCRQSGPVRFGDAELGRIFVDSAHRCLIQDPVLRRTITVEKRGSQSTAVWNPGLQVASKMADLGPSGWRTMVCVESANALTDAVELAPGAEHALNAVYSAQDW